MIGWLLLIGAGVWILGKYIQSVDPSESRSGEQASGGSAGQKPERKERGIGTPGAGGTPATPPGASVVVTLSGLAGALPRAASVLIKGAGFQDLGTVAYRRRGSQRPLYVDSQVQQQTQVNVSFGTWLSAALYLVGKFLDFAKKQQQQNPEAFRTQTLPGGRGSSAGFDLRAGSGADLTVKDVKAIVSLCEDARAEVDFLVLGATRETAVRLFDESNLASSLRTISQLGVPYQGAVVRLCSLVSVKAK